MAAGRRDGVASGLFIKKLAAMNGGGIAGRALSRSRHTIWSNHRALSAVPIPARYVASDLGPAGSVSPGFFFGGERWDQGSVSVQLLRPSFRVTHVSRDMKFITVASRFSETATTLARRSDSAGFFFLAAPSIARMARDRKAPRLSGAPSMAGNFLQELHGRFQPGHRGIDDVLEGLGIGHFQG